MRSNGSFLAGVCNYTPQVSIISKIAFTETTACAAYDVVLVVIFIFNMIHMTIKMKTENINYNRV